MSIHFPPQVLPAPAYNFDKLPKVPFELNGELDWLTNARPHDFNIGSDTAKETAQAIVALQEASEALGLRLPKVFTTFMNTPSLHERIRSNTYCLLYLCTAPISSPIGTGYLIRFLADSQGCLYWYLYLTQDSSDHAVVSSPYFYDTEEVSWQDEEPYPPDIVYCAESFEAFLCRFWLENEIWYAEHEKTPMPEFGLEYIKEYNRRP